MVAFSAVRWLAVLLIFPSGLCFNHWVVTEDGKIEHQVASPFNLRQPFDLMAFIQQEERVSILKELKEELIDYKNEFEVFSEFDSFDESYRALDPECREVKLISTYDLYISTVLPLKHKGIDVHDHLEHMINPPPSEPHCTSYPLNFSMSAMEHLEGVQIRRGLVTPPERSVLSAVDMRMEVFGSLVHHALEKNSTSWVLLNLATLYWRARGHAHHAIECVRRALHYSPYHDRDIALLNLANVLHRSRHSQDAVVALRVAISHAPSVSVLHFTLGNVYAALEQLNESVICFKRCRELDPTCTMSREMYFASLCEHRMEQASKVRSEKLDDTQRKLDLFYSNMELVRKHQNLGGVAERVELGGPEGGGRGKRTKVEIDSESEMESVDATPVLDSELDGDGGGMESVSEDEEMSLELELEQALSRLNSDPDTTPERNHSNKSSEEIKQTRSNFRLVLKPLPPDDIIDSPRPLTKEQSGVKEEEGCGICLEQCPNKILLLFQHSVCPGVCLASGNETELASSENLNQEEGSDVIGNDVTGRVQTGSDGTQYLITFGDELAMFEHIEQELVTETDTKDPQTQTSPQKEYPQSYHSLEFLPYNPLPDQLEAALFPKQHHAPLPVYNDPYWPRKRDCLNLVNEMKNNQKLSSFTGSFITPEARGISLSSLFSPVPIHSEVKKRPNCGEIVDLPHSMVTMDHLEPIMYRANFRRIPQLGERNLRKVLITLASWDLNAELTFEESAERVYTAMRQSEPNWALFNIASLYWRVKGDPSHSIECLRRAVHFAPREARDVGYVGLANVLLRHGYLNEAVIMARASLDINEKSPVAHYTLGHIYLGLRDYVAASLHLRAALNAQPVFNYALTSLKIVRCSLKLKEEQLFLRQKMKEEEQALLRQQELEIMSKLKEAIKSGRKMERTSQPAIVMENKEPPDIPELKMGEMVDSPFTGEDAIRYLARLSLFTRKGEDAESEVKGEEKVEGVDSVEKDGEVKGPEVKSRDDVASEVKGEEGGESSMETSDVGLDGKKSEEYPTRDAEEGRGVSKEGVANSDTENISSKAMGRELTTKKAKSPKSSKKSKKQSRKRRQKPAKTTPPAPPPTDIDWEERRLKLYQEIERDTREALILAAEAINRNQTPVVQESKVYSMPGKRGDYKATPTRKATPHGATPTKKAVTPKSTEKTPPTDETDSSDTTSDDATPNNIKDTEFPPTRTETTPTTNEESTTTETAPTNAIEESPPTNTETTPTDEEEASNETTPARPHGRARPPKHRKTREEVREEEIRKRFPGTRAWPTQEECEEKPLPKTVVFTSTWLSVTAKGVNVKEHLDFKTPVGPHIQLPYCHNDFEQSKKTLSHLTGMNNHPLVQYKAEKGLQEVLCTLDGLRRPLDEVATRVKLAMDNNSTSWVLSNLAALYWRIVGQGQLATKCLKHALYYSDGNERDVALVSLSNVLYRSGFDIDAAVVIHMSLESSPTLVVNHFTMANILAAQGLFVEAAGFYESTLHFQPEFQPAADRLKTVRCLILAAKHKKSKNKDTEIETET